MLQFLTRIFGSRNQRLLKGYSQQVREANALEPAMQALTDEQLRGKTDELRQRLAAGATLEQLIPEAFAAVREASRRTRGLRHFDVQLIGGIALHEGKIAEMRTGEGKTLVATLAAYLNALPGKGVHVVTVNEYLAQRDADWMGPIYRFLGLTVGVIKNSQPAADKRAAYAADITYGTNNEYGFDYLRDNLAFRLEERVQRVGLRPTAVHGLGDALQAQAEGDENRGRGRQDEGEGYQDQATDRSPHKAQSSLGVAAAVALSAALSLMLADLS